MDLLATVNLYWPGVLPTVSTTCPHMELFLTRQ